MEYPQGVIEPVHTIVLLQQAVICDTHEFDILLIYASVPNIIQNGHLLKLGAWLELRLGRGILRGRNHWEVFRCLLLPSPLSFRFRVSFFFLEVFIPLVLQFLKRQFLCNCFSCYFLVETVIPEVQGDGFRVFQSIESIRMSTQQLFAHSTFHQGHWHWRRFYGFARVHIKREDRRW